ncbi:hypothetical protein MPPM_4830 [Methylorubrum populi]|uniref:Uncharacterized protein n=1 Tax=Methylorubrum populi TaxID=223967 RepID=A0A160PK97_9HYPH|nr:hypothetical protein [Methylorubrum populi]BAU93435.1 hypothetical protein MPPM_4830 [Methylorubrum populi]
MIALAILSAFAGSVGIALLSRHLARLDEARDFAPTSHIAIGEEP